jgi:hypothetical protein
MSYSDKQFLRENIFKAIDLAPRGCLENVVFNIAQLDFPERWPGAVTEIE